MTKMTAPKFEIQLNCKRLSHLHIIAVRYRNEEPANHEVG